VLWNTNRKHYEFLLQLPLLALAVPAWWLLGAEGIRAVAIVSALVIYARAAVIITAALRALQMRWTAIFPDLVRGIGLSAICAGGVLAGQYAVAGVSFPGVSLCAGGACALGALLLVVGTRPQVLGRDTQSALASLFPAIRIRWALAPTPKESEPAR